MIEFQTDVPIPHNAGHRGKEPKYPFRTMPVGASFFAPDITSTYMSNSTQHYKKGGLQFAIRTVTENGIKGVRVWRIA